jgi:hypothetical protein
MANRSALTHLLSNRRSKNPAFFALPATRPDWGIFFHECGIVPQSSPERSDFTPVSGGTLVALPSTESPFQLKNLVRHFD